MSNGWTQSIWAVIGFGVLSSSVASVVFWYLLFRLKPKLEISPQIARAEGKNGQPVYRIKVVNKRRRSAFDITPFVYLDEIKKTVEGENKKNHFLERLTVNGSSSFFLHKYSKRDDDARYARKLLILSDIDGMWDTEQKYSVVIRIFAKDGVSGAIWQDEKRYGVWDCIVDGEFEWGRSLKIKPPKKIGPAETKSEGAESAT
ncbi:hypothetical protein MHPYR_60225 [uncultured Mycobacterium sp.]|uniref:Uncharacterized protein n=1 Tax=uncultured Mycobacterium sp. TaxID=171292 RepID=A0A1Y5PJ25_9MYCO|nr:hypothetical protein MHPYR_60225 [uncultured Mycobacterium sp.]